MATPQWLRPKAGFWTLHSKTYGMNPLKDLLRLKGSAKDKGQHQSRAACVEIQKRGEDPVLTNYAFKLEDGLTLIWQVSLQCKVSKTHQRNFAPTEGAPAPFDPLVSGHFSYTIIWSSALHRDHVL